MRYQDWDVLLFPTDSRTPIQEFNTKCHVLLHKASTMVQEPSLATFESMIQTPILTSFIASLSQGSAFRVSLHNWEKAQPSELLKRHKMPEEAVMFEARVYVDGILQAHRTFQEHNLWPEVIDTTGTYGTADITNQLRFPPFHSEILKQSHWEASEQFGRIRVVIAEGVMRETCFSAPQRFTFDRLRDIVAFSFQHAPQSILEQSGIAWPNAKMFSKPMVPSRRPAPIGSRIGNLPGHEAHSHSPRRSSSALDDNLYAHADVRRNGLTHSQISGQPIVATPATSGGQNILCGFEDPFMGPPSVPAQNWRLQLRTSSHDASMPDYTSSKTGHSRANTEMSGISYSKKDFQKHMNEAAIQEIVQALSPIKKEELVAALSPGRRPLTGWQAPENTPLTTTGTGQTPSPSVKPQSQVIAKLLSTTSAEKAADSRASSIGSTSSASSGIVPKQSASSTGNPRRSKQRDLETITIGISPIKPSDWQCIDEGIEIAFRDTDRSWIEANRRRSSSNASKRKRSLSPKATKKGPRKVVMEDESSSGLTELSTERDAGQTGAIHAMGGDGGVSVDD